MYKNQFSLMMVSFSMGDDDYEDFHNQKYDLDLRQDEAKEGW